MIASIINSPLGDLLALSDGINLTGLYFSPFPQPVSRYKTDVEAVIFQETRRQVVGYFEGKLKLFHLPIRMHGTPFQCRVWELLLRIPYGQTVSYKQLAIWLGSPGSVRAVGNANGKNPISIVVPCHRVIGANNALIGYGGGLERKAALLDLERTYLANELNRGIV